MLAIECPEFNEYEVVEIARDEPDHGEVSIAVDRVQLSVTECSLYRGERIAHFETVQRRMEHGDPRLFGHEFCGRVAELGDGVNRFEVGDRVYAPGKIACDACAYCERGFGHLCSNTRGIGFDLPGALSEFVCLPIGTLRELPSEISDAAGAAMQPLASALLCVIDADITPGDTVVVLGAGVMGYQCAQLATRLGAGEVFAVDVRPEALGLMDAQGFGTLDATERDVVEAILDETADIGADVVFEAVGGEQDDLTAGSDPLAQAFRMVRRGGTMVSVGHVFGEMTVTPRKLRSKCVRWINPRKGFVSLGPNMDTGQLAPYLVAAGRVTIEELTTHELRGLESFGEAVEITLHKREHGALGPAQILV